MAPRRNAKGEETAAPAAVSLSPRRTRSGAVGKRVAPPPAAPKPKKKIRIAGVKDKSVKVKEEKKKEAGEAAPATGEAKSIIIEACKQCNAFKTRALKVKEGLESGVPGISVTINPEKPRRGCFEIREEGGEIFVSLLNMPRPFTPMKKLDMDELIQDIIKKIA
ncbi:selenium binding protein [Carex rostrata]